MRMSYDTINKNKNVNVNVKEKKNVLVNWQRGI